MPTHLAKQKFGVRLLQLMKEKRWNQSELGRRAGLPRDAISVYIRGKSFPTPANLKALADALGVSEEDLLPSDLQSVVNEDEPAFELRASSSAPHLAWLRINRLVSLSTGIKIAELLENDRIVGSNVTEHPTSD